MTAIKLLLTLAFSWLIFTVNATRGDGIKPGQNIAARLEGEGGGGITECWSALLELKSCTDEIILFFINGESYLGMGCCRAIPTITHYCWPSMLTSLGYTAEEGDILSDYCGRSAPPQPDVEESVQSPVRLRI